MLRSGKYASQTALGQRLGVSRARVNQMLRLLKLPPEVQEAVARMGDPLTSRKITERKLRNLFGSTPGGYKPRIDHFSRYDS